MKKELIVSRVYIGVLIILLLNDFLFKSWFSNFITGKLSDFAGLFVFPIFWYCIFPNYKKAIFTLTGLCFIFWKSEYS